MFEEERIGEFLKQIKERTVLSVMPLSDVMMAKTCGETRPVPGSDSRLEWEKVSDETIWGGDNEYFAFKATAEPGKDMCGREVVFSLETGREGEWDATNPQFTAFINGRLRQGMDVNHTTVLLSPCAKEGEKYEIFLSAFTGIQNFRLLFRACLKALDRKAADLYYDLLAPYETARVLEKDDDDYGKIIRVLTEAVNMLDLRRTGSEEYYAGIEKAEEILRSAFYERCTENGPSVRCVGHTHIDIAWLWTVKVTRDKAVRSFSTALELMRRYPDFTFMSSQPQLYKFVKEDAPEVYDEIKERINEGRWEAEGATFLEPDCNLTSGESLVRQFLYGKKFFREEFGKDSKILWLPDVFGYSAALPQIMLKCGVPYFMTTKISWNEVNKMPYDTFYWKGIDGSRVLAYFVTTRDLVSPTRDTKTSNEFCTEFSTNYNGYINPSEIKGAWQRYQQKELSEDILCSYGYGDGGGGATAEMVEMGKRLGKGIPGCPRTVDSKALDFFKTLEKNIEGKKVPQWSGELYLEYHRGTYTSMADIKRANRKGEFALLNTELYSVLSGNRYPKDSIDACWEILLRNQFHDILPGSAVKEVYEDTRREFKTLFETASEICSESKRVICKNRKGITVYNPNGFTASGIAALEGDGACEGAQKTADGKRIVYAESVPPKGYMTFAGKERFFEKVSVSTTGIATPFAEIKFDGCGMITSWFDRTEGRELLKSGRKGNVLTAFDDRPHKFDNWNIFDYYREKYWVIDDLVKAEVTEEGPIRYAVRFEWKYLGSTVSETVYAYPFTGRIDFRFEADWHESQTLLKAVFPLEMNTDEATFEIQYGNVTRKTHMNTSWDTARFESCMHKWMDVSEGGYGVSFLNDCKYGVSVLDNDVGISLIKCGNYPNPEADRGRHEAVYSVFPHSGSWMEAGTAREAYLLNNPMDAVYNAEGEENAGDFSFACSDRDNVMIEAVKKAEDGSGDVVRFYEYMNRRCRATIKLGKKYSQIWQCDMLENREKLIGEDTDTIGVEMLPYGIETLKLI